MKTKYGDEEQEDVQPQPLDLMTAALKAGERNALPLLMDTPAGMRCCKLAKLCRDEGAKASRLGAVVLFHRCPEHGDSAPWETEGDEGVPCSCGAARYSAACSLLPEHPHVQKTTVANDGRCVLGRCP